MNLENIVKESFSQYSGAVLQSRALVDVRDCLKPSARQIFFSMKERKLTHKNPFKKTANAVGMAMADYYLHGDSSCEGIIMRAGQPFAYRYPLIEVEGSYGNLIESGNWAAPRYTSSRLSKIAEYLFKNLEKNSISDWRDSYDNTKQYPMVLPSLGFFNIVNGSLGIGVGASSSIPQFNLREVNQSLIKLLWNPEIPDDELICLPDFATGGILLNEEEVRQSLIHGKGKAIKLRSVIEYDEKDRCLIVKEIPYSVYTNTICKQLENLIESQPTLGINHFNDLTGEHPYIKIYLNKNVNPSKVLKTLYQETSLQYHYSINFTMLEDGKFPKVFTWKEILNSHLNHEKKVYRKSFEYDLSKIQERIHILQGLLIALASINEVIEIIKKSGSSIEAAIQLQSNFELDEVQAKAILDLKLARLAKLEVNKLQSELLSLEKEQEKLNSILTDTNLFYKEIEKGLNNVINEFGDNRRTKVMNLLSEENNEEEVKEKIMYNVMITDKNRLLIQPSTSLTSFTTNNFNLLKNELPIFKDTVDILDKIFAVTNLGHGSYFSINNLKDRNVIDLNEYFNLQSTEKVFYAAAHLSDKPILFVTKNGFAKRLKFSELDNIHKKNIIVIDTIKNDEVILVSPIDDNNQVIVTTKDGKTFRIDAVNIPVYLRMARGIILKHPKAPNFIGAGVIKNPSDLLVSCTDEGNMKATSIEEFPVGDRQTRGILCHDLRSGENLAGTTVIDSTVDKIIVKCSRSIQNVYTKEIPISGRVTKGNKMVNLKESEIVRGIRNEK